MPKQSGKKPLVGKKCYDHLGGSLGAMLLEFYVENGWLAPEAGEKSTVYKVTEKGLSEFAKMGLQMDPEAI